MGVQQCGGKVGPPILWTYTTQSNFMAELQIPSSNVQLDTFFTIPCGRRRTLTLSNLYPNSVPSMEYALGHYTCYMAGTVDTTLVS